MSASRSILVIGFVWPEPTSSAAGSRMMNLLSLFDSRGYEIIFASAAGAGKHMADLESRGIERVSLDLNCSTFDKFISERNPDLVLFDRFVTEEQFGWRVAKHAPEAIRILDTEDLHSLRRARGRAVEEGRTFRERDLLEEPTAVREIASIYRSDLSLIISEYEMQLLRELFNIDTALLHYLPFYTGTVNSQIRESWPSFDKRSGFAMIGNFSHDPNSDAVHYLKKELWPGIRKQLPGAEVRIYGAYPTDDILALHDEKTGFMVEGRVKDAQTAVKASRVCLAPLRFGAGLKGKLVEAMQCGTPSVTTPIGAEGISGSLPWSGIVTEDRDEFISAAVSLYKDEKAWQKAQARGIDIINTRFATETHRNSLLNRLDEIRNGLEEHRARNFTGRMLRHHTMASTEYMSRWIEIKERMQAKS